MNDEKLKTLITQFLTGTDELTELIHRVKEADFDLSEGPGEWTMRQIIHHLEDDGDVYSFVIKRAISTPGAEIVLKNFPGNEAWSDGLRNSQRPVEHSLALIREHRHVISEVVALNPEKLENEVLFFGEDDKPVSFNVTAMIEMLTNHMTEHLTTLRRIKTLHSI